MATERIACPMCGWWRTVKWGVDQRTGNPREVRFDKVDVANAALWRLEKLAGAGRGSKDARIELLDSKKLVDLPEETREQIRQQCHKILEVLNEGPAPTPQPRKPRGKAKPAESE